MKNFTQLKHFDPAPMLNKLSKLPNTYWKEDTYLRDYPQGPFGDTETIILRFPPISVKETEKELADHFSKVDEHENIWHDASKDFPEAKELIYKLAYETGATRIGRCLINKLNPNGKIYRHADTPSHANYWCRFHIVLAGLPGVKFRCGDEEVEMQTGEIWFFRNELEHEVHNESEYPRVHLIVDLKIEEMK
jgi:quercetin dioxygenase-like cupin family protein